MYRPGFPLSAGQVDVQMSSKAGSPGHGSPLPPGTPLCEDGRPYVTDPVTGRKICMCNLGAEAPYSHHSLLPGARKHVGLPVTAGIPTVGFDATAFYSPLIRGMPMRQDRLPPYLTSAMPGQPVTFDPAISAHPYGLLYAGMDMNGGPIRKAATRETTGPLKAWLSEHKKNPYPTKAEKIMLAIITRMSLTQVSTWFANARRRLKKENKLYPASGNRDDDDDDDDDASDNHRDRNKAQSLGSEHNILSDSDNEDINVDLSDCSDVDDDVVSSSAQRAALNLTSPGAGLDIDHSGPSPDTHHQQLLHQHNQHHDLVNKLNHKSQIEGRSVLSANAKAASSNAASDKPKIWSISEIISGPSPSDSSHKRHHALGHPSLHHNTPSALSYPSSSSTSMRRVSPNSSSVTFASSPLSVSPFSSSSSSSPISPPAFRPIPSIMGASPLFLHRPELSSFVSRYSLPLSTNGLHVDQQTLASIPITHNLETVATAARDTSLLPKPLDRTLDHNNSDYSPSKTSNNLVIKPEEDPHPQDSPKDKHYRHKSMSPPLSASETPSRIPTSSAMHSPSHTKANMQRNHTTPSPEKPASYNSDRPKLSAPYKPKTQNALNGTGTADSEVALDLQTKKRTISDT